MSQPSNYIAPFLEVGGKVYSLQKLSNKHHAIMDYMLANPGLPLAAVADHFHVTQPWLSTVINSDVWRERYNQRRNLMDERLNESITTKLGILADETLDGLTDAVRDAEVSIPTKLDIAKTALQALGFLGNGGKNNQQQQSVQPAPSVNIAITAVQQARERLQAKGESVVLDSLTIEHKD